MKKILRGLVAAVCLLPAFLFASSVTASKAPQIETLYVALQAVDDDILQKGGAYDFPRFQAAFENELATQSLASSTDADAETIYRAARFASFRTFNRPYVARMRAALDELQHRSLARELHYEQMAAMYIGARDMAAARDMNRHLPAGKQVVVPNLVDEAGDGTAPSILALARAGSAWNFVRRRADLSGRRTVILASPACGFSRRFFEEVKRNEALARFVAGSLIVMPQVMDPLVGEVHSWNEANADFRMGYVYAESEWRMIDYWGTPTFYFLEDGRVKEKIVGWQPDVTLPKLLAAYRDSER